MARERERLHGRGKEGEKERRSLLKRLFSSGLRSRSAGRLLGSAHLSDAEGSPPPASDLQPLPSGVSSGDPGTPPCTPPMAAAGETPLAADGTSAGGTPTVAGGLQEGQGSGGRSLMVQVIGARRLRAADSNGFSDPYCVVRVGPHKAASKTELKTLCPRWNETMCFSAADVEEAEAEGRPWVALRVFDWDLVSADDFLGQAELLFRDIDPSQQAPGAATWLPLYGWKGGAKSGKKVDAGEIHVAAWFETRGDDSQQGGSTLSTLCCQPGARKRVPQVVHSQAGSLYEEPLIACLAVTLERLEGLHVPTGTQSGASPLPKAPGPAGGAVGDASPGSRSHSGSPQGGGAPLGGILGRLLHRRANHKPGRRALTHSTSLSSVVSDDMLAGEDYGDEYEDLHFYEEADAESTLADADGEDGDDGGAEGAGGTPRTPRRWRRRSGDEGGLKRVSPQGGSSLARASPVGAARGRTPSSAPALQPVEEGALLGDGVGADGALTGMRCYARLVLGRQKHTSWIKKERTDGSVSLQQTFVFAVPLPLRDRQLRVELYRTASNTQRGRLISMANVWLCDLLPPGLADDLAATQRNSVDLDSMVKHQPGGRAVLRSTFVDTDMRRAMYRAGFVEDGEGAAAGGGGDAEPAAASGGGDAGPALSRLESSTEAYTGVELRMKALKSEQSFIAWQHSAPGVVATAAAGAWSQLVPAASDLALSSWRRVSRILSATGDEAANGALEDAGEAGGAAAPKPPPPLPQPAGSLVVTIERLQATASAGSECFIVLKSGPHWARSKALMLSGQGAAECGWQLSLPLLDPSTLLTLGVFQQTRGVKRGLRAPMASSSVQAVGKLRVRLSCLWPNTPLSAELPLLGERTKGARAVGTVRLTLQANYASAKHLAKGYTAPALPKAAYVHGVAEKAHQVAMARECRRIVMRWLDGANPAISNPVALFMLDAEREVFAVSRARVNARRIQMALVGIRRAKRKFDDIKTWKEPQASVAAMLGVVFTCFAPRLALPALLAWLVLTTLASQPGDAGLPAPMEQDPPGIEPENESLETTTVNPVANLRAKVDRLQRLGLMVQTVLDEVACAMERAGALLSWQDPTATLGACIVLSVVAALIFLLGLSAVLAVAGCFVIRPPALRTPTPPMPAVVFGKLPSRRDRIV